MLKTVDVGIAETCLALAPSRGGLADEERWVSDGQLSWLLAVSGEAADCVLTWQGRREVEAEFLTSLTGRQCCGAEGLQIRRAQWCGEHKRQAMPGHQKRSIDAAAALKIPHENHSIITIMQQQKSRTLSPQQSHWSAIHLKFVCRVKYQTVPVVPLQNSSAIVGWVLLMRKRGNKTQVTPKDTEHKGRSQQRSRPLRG